MRRILIVSALIAVAALSGGCSSLHDTGSSTNTNSTTTNTATTGAAPKSAPVSSAPTVGGAAPPQAKPSPTSEAGIKPPTKNQH